MKKTDIDFKICTMTLLSVIVMTLINRFVYSGFSLSRRGVVSKYDFELWKEYWEWLTGKIICIVTALLIIVFAVECCLMIFKRRKKS